MTTRLIVLVILTVVVFTQGTIKLSEKTIASLDRDLLRSSSTGLRSYLGDIVDLVIKKLRPYIVSAGYDPFRVPDTQKSFSWIIFQGKLDLIDGILWNLSTLHRTGELTYKWNEKEKHISLSVPIGFNELRYISDYHAKVWKIGPSGSFKSKVTDVETNTTLTLDLSSRLLILNQFDITKAGDITVHFSESSMDWVLNLISKYIIPCMHDHIINTAEDAITKFINRTLLENIYI